MSQHNDNAPTADITATADPLDLTTNLVAAYVANNSLPAAELPGLIASVHSTLAGLATGSAAPAAETTEPAIETPTPAQIRKSVTPDGIISFLDGRSYKTLKRHLGVHGLDPRGYRTRYGLPADYPMVAPSYAAQRSALAKRIGLGVPGGMVQAAGGTEGAAPAPRKGARKAA